MQLLGYFIFHIIKYGCLIVCKIILFASIIIIIFGELMCRLTHDLYIFIRVIIYVSYYSI